MKESGLNYFYGAMNLDTGSWGVYYGFEDGAGTLVRSVSGAQSGFSGTLSSIGAFWSSPGSGYFSGQRLTISNASGLDSVAWTKVFVYEKVDVNPCVLFDSLGGGTGYRIGITKANKPYMEGFSAEPVVAASLNNYSSKNVVSFTYMPNYLTIGLYNWNSQTVESETFSYPFNVQRSDAQYLGGSFTGYMDTYIHLTQPMSVEVQSQWFSGFFARPTGIGSVTTTICTTGITGYRAVFVGQTGVTGYVITPGGDDGKGYYTGAFPSTHTESALTGYLSTGLYMSGLSGISCYTTTGAPTVLFDYQSGYAASFGMEKIQYYAFLATGDTVKNAVSYTPFADLYNKGAARQYSGYAVDVSYETGILDLYLNGVALDGQNWATSGGYVTVGAAESQDSLFYDLKSGDKRTFVVTGAPSSYTLSYSGQELYLNGINLVSGADYTQGGALINLTAANSGVTGYLSEYPIILTSTTGRYTIWTGARFWRNTSNVYRNGVRQENKVLYIEGAMVDKLSGQFFNPADCVSLYQNTDLYWE